MVSESSVMVSSGSVMVSSRLVGEDVRDNKRELKQRQTNRQELHQSRVTDRNYNIVSATNISKGRREILGCSQIGHTK